MEKLDNNLNITILVNLLKENSIRHIVISPGGTNIAFVKAVQDDPYFKCYSVVDERSAMYFAIGLYLQTGEIIATSCTSAQATRNYVPGLTEAFYKHVPILAITMEKHPRFTYQDYMQAPNQKSLPEDCVKKSYDLPFISDENDALFSMRLVNEAILEITHNGFGPVQICIPMIDFPISKIELRNKFIKRYDRNLYAEDFTIGQKRILLVVGEHRPFSKEEENLIEQFSENYNVAIYVNHLSNYHGKYAINANLTLQTMQYSQFSTEFAPEIVISIGGQTGDYPLYRLLSRVELNNVDHWRISVDGNVVDTYDKLTRVVTCTEEQFFSQMICFGNQQSMHEYYHKWESEINKKNTCLNFPFSNAYAANKMHDIIPSNSIIQFAILNSLRIWNFFSLPSSIQCYSNVGAFGIDGGLSTLIGQSVISDNLCFMITGDLAFYYDMNSLGIRHIKNNVRVLIINNNGGVEFKLNNSNKHVTDRYISACNHYKNAEGWAEACGFKYIKACSKSEFDLNVNDFISESDLPIVFEIFVEDCDETQAYHQLLEENTRYGLKDTLKENVKKTLVNLERRKK